MVKMTAVGDTFVQNGSTDSCVVFFCIGCKAHCMVDFAFEALCEITDERGLITRLQGQPIGMPIHCVRCLVKDTPDGDLRQLVDTRTLSVIESVLGSQLYFYEQRVGIVSGQDARPKYSICSARTFLPNRWLFTGRVQEVDPVTERLVAADLERFFGFTGQPEEVV